MPPPSVSRPPEADVAAPKPPLEDEPALETEFVSPEPEVAPEPEALPEPEIAPEPEAFEESILAPEAATEQFLPPLPEADAKLELARELDAAAEASPFPESTYSSPPAEVPAVPEADVSSERGLLLDDQWLLFYCPSCSNLIKVDAEKTGSSVSCAGCHQEFSLDIDPE